MLYSVPIDTDCLSHFNMGFYETYLNLSNKCHKYLLLQWYPGYNTNIMDLSTFIYRINGIGISLNKTCRAIVVAVCTNVFLLLIMHRVWCISPATRVHKFHTRTYTNIAIQNKKTRYICIFWIYIYTAHKKFMNGFACHRFNPYGAIISTGRRQKITACKSTK